VSSVALALVLAGCVAAPVDGPVTHRDGVRTAQYSASNAGSGAYVFTVSLASSIEGFVVTDANDTTKRYPTASLDEVPQPVVDRAVRVVPVGDEVRTFAHRLRPGESIGNTVEPVPREAVFVYSVATPTGDEPMRAVGVATCGETASEFGLDVRIGPEDTVDVSTICRG
jgi:hypothetical protein